MAGIRRFVQKIISHLIYPVKPGDWYKAKGYHAHKDKDCFQNFVHTQQGLHPEQAAVFTDFQYVDATRNMVDATLTHQNKARLETVTLKPKKGSDTKGKSGHGKHMIYFFGRNEPLEVKYRELLTDVTNLGCTVHAFNLPGMHNSTGRMLEYNDAINCGLAQVNRLLGAGVNRDDIILKGNCFGASIATDVAHHSAIQNVQIRCINSNSYKSLRDVIVESIPLIKELARSVVSYFSILDYTGWYSDLSEKNLVTTPCHCTISRIGDQTIKNKATLTTAMAHNVAGINPEELQIPGFEASQQFLDAHNKMTLKPGLHKDPHIVAFGDLEWENGHGKKEAWQFVDEFLTRSNEYLDQHPQKTCHKALQPLTHRVFQAVSMKDLQHLNNATAFQQGMREAASTSAREAFAMALSARAHTSEIGPVKIHTPDELTAATHQRSGSSQDKSKDKC